MKAIRLINLLILRTLGVPIGADPDHTANEYLHATSEYCDHSSWVPALVRIHTLPCRRSLVRVHRMKAARNSATGESEIRVIELRRRNACGRQGTSASPAWQAPAGPASSGQGPQAGGAGRANSARFYRMEPAPWRQAGEDTGHHRSPTRVRPSPRRRSGTLVLLLDAADLPDHRRIDALLRTN
jgi:hypothetical protein